MSERKSARELQLAFLERSRKSAESFPVSRRAAAGMKPPVRQIDRSIELVNGLTTRSSK